MVCKSGLYGSHLRKFSNVTMSNLRDKKTSQFKENNYMKNVRPGTTVKQTSCRSKPQKTVITSLVGYLITIYHSLPASLIDDCAKDGVDEFFTKMHCVL